MQEGSIESVGTGVWHGAGSPGSSLLSILYVLGDAFHLFFFFVAVVILMDMMYFIFVLFLLNS